MKKIVFGDERFKCPHCGKAPRSRRVWGFGASFICMGSHFWRVTRAWKADLPGKSAWLVVSPDEADADSAKK